MCRRSAHNFARMFLLAANRDITFQPYMKYRGLNRKFNRRFKLPAVLCQKLSDTVKYRMKGFEAVDIVDILGALWIMVPADDELFEMLENRILEKIEDFTALNFIGVIRIFNKRSSKHHALLEKIVPRLRELLGHYEGVELSEMLVSMAQSAEAATDMDVSWPWCRR